MLFAAALIVLVSGAVRPSSSLRVYGSARRSPVMYDVCTTSLIASSFLSTVFEPWAGSPCWFSLDGEEEEEDDDEGANSDSSCATGRAALRYHGREMECLSIMLKEGDSWLEQLAEVLEGSANGGDGDGGAAEEEAHAAAVAAAAAAAAAGTADPTRRTSSRAGRGTRAPRLDDDDSDDDARASSKVNMVWISGLLKTFFVVVCWLHLLLAVEDSSTMGRVLAFFVSRRANRG